MRIRGEIRSLLTAHKLRFLLACRACLDIEHGAHSTTKIDHLDSAEDLKPSPGSINLGVDAHAGAALGFLRRPLKWGHIACCVNQARGL